MRLNKFKLIKILLLFILIIFYNDNKVYALISTEKNINFKRITIEDGLSQTTVQYIFQDSKGYMWFATTDGLNRYNGYEFKVYKYNKGSNESISGNFIVAINEDEEGNIWVGTTRGLNKINNTTNLVKQYLPDVDGCNISDYNITEIFIDSKKDIYITTANGLNIYDKENDNFKRVYGNEDGENTLSSQAVYSIVEDKNNNFWIGTDNGLNKVESKTGRITNYYAEDGKNTISDNFIYKLYMDDLNNLWIGTDSQGLNKLDIDKGKFEIFLNDKDDKNSIGGNSIPYILKDRNSNLWVATNNGLSKYDEKNNNFITYVNKVYDNQSLIDNSVLSLFEDKEGNIWVGTYNGISMFNLDNTFFNYRHDPLNINSINNNMMAGIYEDSDGLLWVGTTENGINIIDRSSNTVFKYTEKEDGSSINNNNIKDIVGIENEIWISTDKGLNKYDKLTDSFTYYTVEDYKELNTNDLKSLYIDRDGTLWITSQSGLISFDRKNKFKSYNYILKEKGITEYFFSDIVEDEEGILWIGSALNGGLIGFNKNTNEVKVYKSDENNNKTLSYNGIKTLALDNENNLWIGTQYGLNKFNKYDEIFTRYTEIQGLSNNFINGIVVDDEDNIWVSTNYGISKYDKNDDKFINYDVTDGLQGNEFNGYAYYKNKDGYIFFGGINGLTYFNPRDLVNKSVTPKVVIENIKSNEVKYNDFSNIKLDYSNKNIQFDFFIPDYRNTKKVQYSYKLVGLDEEWITSNNRNYASYTNLDSGEYIFMVSARNSTGNWSEPVSIKFKVSVEPWKSPVAYFIYIVIGCFVVYVIWNRVKILDGLVTQRTYELNNKLKENKALYNKLIENEKYKNNYFINLSHELRTPLNVIISIEQLITDLNNKSKEIPKDKLKHYMNMLRKNSERLLNLINNIIDTSKIDSGSYKLNMKENDIVYIVEEVAMSMKDFIESKGIELIIDPEIEEKIIICDKIEIEKCIINLLGNAVKFTPNGGKIEVYIYDLNDEVKISVKDTGVGIDKKYQEIIFDRFSQAYNNISEENGGSGLGLTLVKQLVKLHKGNIYLESELGKGSEFIIILPVKQG